MSKKTFIQIAVLALSLTTAGILRAENAKPATETPKTHHAKKHQAKKKAGSKDMNSSSTSGQMGASQTQSPK